MYTLRGVCFSYAGRAPVLDVNELHIRRGSITALLGPNGAGKTTLLSLLAFLNPPDCGVLRFSGRECDGSNLTDLRRRVGLVPQKPYFLNGTVLQNVELGLKLRGVSMRGCKMSALQALERVAARQFAKESVKSLSGGEIQRIALARMLALDPEVLLFDEPFTFLDSSASRMIEAVIREVVDDSETTVVFSTHDKFHGIALADHVVALVNGRIVDRPLVNFFSGRVVDGQFDTGQIRIFLPDGTHSGGYVCIDPNEIALSLEPLVSSMRNRIPGKVRSIVSDSANIRITVEGAERFEVLVTRKTLEEFGFTVGDPVWVNFKSTALKVFSTAGPRETE